jgi:hypothetical protein
VFYSIAHLRVLLDNLYIIKKKRAKLARFFL